MSQSKTILITGAGSGLGRSLCEYFGEAKLEVIASDVNGAAAEETARTIRDAGGIARAMELDVTRQPDVAVALRELRVDMLVNNAGIQHVAALEEFPPEKWSSLIDILLKGTCWMTRAALPGMRERNFGRIVNIGSVHSLVASPYKSAYVAAKHGLLGFSKVVALETADKDITINTICPAYIHTPLVDKQIKAQAAKHGIPEGDVINTIMLKPMPKKRFIAAAEIAGTIEFLVGPASINITGQTIVIDGGWTAA
jgi:3-hydroxybutyrate dehydrogenase